jgi:hypothetical protein
MKLLGVHIGLITGPAMSQAVDPVVRSSSEQIHRIITDPAAREDVDPITLFFTVLLKQTLSVAALLALVVSIILLILYRRVVLKSMRAQTGEREGRAVVPLVLILMILAALGSTFASALIGVPREGSLYYYYTVYLGSVLGDVFVLIILFFVLGFAVFDLAGRLVLRRSTDQHERNLRATEPVPLEASTPPNRSVQAPVDLAVLNGASPIRIGPAAKALYSNLLHSPWRTAAIYGFAGLCFAFVMTAATLAAANQEFLPSRVLMVLWIFAWPVVLTVNLVAAATWRAKLATVSVYFLIFAALGATLLLRGSESSWQQLAMLWLMFNIPVTVLFLAFLNRRIRAVGPLVLTFILLAVLGSTLVFFIQAKTMGQLSPEELLSPERLSVFERLIIFVSNLGWDLGLGMYSIYTLRVLSFAVFGVAGWLALRWIRSRYEHKQISDQSLTLDAIWLLYGVIQSSSDLVFEGPAWGLFGLVAFVVYKLVAWAGFSLLNHKATSDRKSTGLLLLRVFSLGKRSERLFDVLAKHWRHAGSLQLISGPDLATTTVEPHELLDFLSGKLARRFIDGPQTLDLRLSEMDQEPDRDGRFRVNDFFCHEDTWRMTLSRLVSESDAVLMDLRGFSANNAGVIYEIDELINVVPVERIVFVVDDTTDERFLRQTVQQSWDRMKLTSPNRSSTSGQLRLFRVTGSHGAELRRLLRALCDAAKSTTPVDRSKPAAV